MNGTPVFTRGAMKRIVKEAKGIPRILNILCDNALITGFGYKKRPVNAKIVDEVITDYKGGEKGISLPKLIITSAALLLLFVLVLFFISNKDLILSKVGNIFSRSERIPISAIENPGSSRTATGDPTKEQMESSGNPSKVSQPEQNL
jgi:hypothetical protein